MTIREDMVRESQELFLPGTDAKHQTVQWHDSMTERLLLKKKQKVCISYWWTEPIFTNMREEEVQNEKKNSIKIWNNQEWRRWNQSSKIKSD